MDARKKALRQRLKNDFIFYAENCLKLRAKSGTIIPFILNDAQKAIHAALEE